MYIVDCFFDIKHTFFKNQISQSCDKRKCRLYGCKKKRHRLAEDKVRRLTEAQFFLLVRITGLEPAPFRTGT